ncbi:MAG: hypothetical protein WBQ60_02720 [Asticcacaulis sp.]
MSWKYFPDSSAKLSLSYFFNSETGERLERKSYYRAQKEFHPQNFVFILTGGPFEIAGYLEHGYEVEYSDPTVDGRGGRLVYDFIIKRLGNYDIVHKCLSDNGYIYPPSRYECNSPETMDILNYLLKVFDGILNVKLGPPETPTHMACTIRNLIMECSDGTQITVHNPTSDQYINYPILGE